MMKLRPKIGETWRNPATQATYKFVSVDPDEHDPDLDMYGIEAIQGDSGSACVTAGHVDRFGWTPCIVRGALQHKGDRVLLWTRTPERFALQAGQYWMELDFGGLVWGLVEARASSQTAP